MIFLSFYRCCSMVTLVTSVVRVLDIGSKVYRNTFTCSLVEKSTLWGLSIGQFIGPKSRFGTCKSTLKIKQSNRSFKNGLKTGEKSKENSGFASRLMETLTKQTALKLALKNKKVYDIKYFL